MLMLLPSFYNITTNKFSKNKKSRIEISLLIRIGNSQHAYQKLLIFSKNEQLKAENNALPKYMVSQDDSFCCSRVDVWVVKENVALQAQAITIARGADLHEPAGILIP